ncbi:L,D-transpeptidase family protein [Starkeya koreensis]|uniref:L,D-transpeptidase family protein n=1 Tax=Ancylobacter koreensis TaxID=266121 RepID=A0ABT0DLA6_9HYPH|nr:L,D-transpeptidase family protein [Ancylobacter koreensis]MCK0208060.1 L,D-transpeptidase family protein [Ancylobacter koreensis]
MSGRGEMVGRGRAGRVTAAGGLALALAAFGLAIPGPAPARAQEMSGTAIALDRAGNGTGDGHSGASQIYGGGQGASPLPVVAADSQPFDMTGARTPSPARSAALALYASPTDAVTPSEPSIGAGAPGTGSGTSGPAPAHEATPAANPAPVGTPASASPAPASTTPPASTPPAVAAPSAPAAPVPGATVPAKLAELLGGPLVRLTPRQSEQQALVAFYTARGFQPVFTGAGKLAPLGQIALDTFAAAAVEGLNPADYAVPVLPAAPSDAQLAEMELRLAATTLLYARHAQSGRFNPATISKDVDPSPTVPDPAGVLASVSGQPNPRAAFAAFAPQYDEYRLLKQQLARLMAEGQVAGHAPIPPGPLLRPGESDPRVPLLRARLGIGGAPEDEIYDSLLVEAVRDFQRLSGQNADGIVGRATIGALNGSGGDQIPEIIANMERWRWVPHDVAPIYVMVNIPEFMVRAVVNEQTVHETRVVVGKPETPTPLLSETMQYAVFNPSWNVPPSIIRNEMLPKLMSDPYALERQGIDVVRNGRIVDPGSVDWSRGAQGYAFRQEPGERNALGRMKFMFPNKHAVYLHDTPSRALFARERRAFSHGCVRVHEPLAFAEVLFSLGLPGEGWTQPRIGKLIGGNEKSVPLKRRFPVHLVYFTTYVDADGRLVTREDLYGINAATKTILGLDGTRRVADRGPSTLAR